MNISLLVLTAILLGCNKNTSDDKNLRNYEIITIDLDNIKPIKLSEICKSIKYLKLETTETNAFGLVTKICISDNKMYLFSPYPFNTVSVFSIQGKFLYQLKRQGKGPGEYLDLQDMHVDEYIELLDHINKKILRFNLNGSFVNEYKIEIYADKFEKLNKDTLIFFANNTYNVLGNEKINHNLFFMSLNMHKIIAKFLPINENFETILVRDFNNFSKYKNNWSFFHSYNDTVYEILDTKNVVPRYLVDFGKYKIPKQILMKKFKDAKELGLTILKSNYVYRFGNFREFENIIFFSFIHNLKRYHVYYSKLSRELRCFNTLIIDLDNSNLEISLQINDKALAAYENNLIFILEPHEFVSIIDNKKKSMPQKDWYKFKEKNHHLIDLYESTTNMDNPILMFFEIKDF